MGRKGPPPVPTEVLKLRGSRLVEKRGAEIKPPTGAPRRPSHFTDEQKAVWRRLCRILAEIRVLTVADGGPLERYVVYFCRWQECERFIAANGISYPVKNDEPGAYVGKLADTSVVGFMEYPQVRETHRLDAALRRTEIEFGLTPAARARLAVDVGIANKSDGDTPTIAAFTRTRDRA